MAEREKEDGREMTMMRKKKEKVLFCEKRKAMEGEKGEKSEVKQARELAEV